MFKTRLRKTDILFSKIIRERDNWTCQACGKDYHSNHQGLHCSHYYSRGRENTRFDETNCISLCFYHHQLWGHGDGRDEYREFMIKRLGQEGFDNLTLRSNLYCKRDDKMVMLYLKEMLKDE